jgi:hypothetical protein
LPTPISHDILEIRAVAHYFQNITRLHLRRLHADRPENFITPQAGRIQTPFLMPLSPEKSSNKKARWSQAFCLFAFLAFLVSFM